MSGSDRNQEPEQKRDSADCASPADLPESSAFVNLVKVVATEHADLWEEVVAQVLRARLNRLIPPDDPDVIPIDELEKLHSYRDAVVACWSNRRAKGMSNRTLAELTGIRPSHISDYLSPVSCDSKGKERREMPAKYLPAFEAVAGNTIVTQWLRMQTLKARKDALAVIA